MKNKYFAGLALLLIFAAAPSLGATGAKEMNQAAEAANIGIANNDLSLEGVSWALDSYITQEGNAVSVLSGTEVTALFESGRVGGSGGCNNYGASYVTDGNNITIGQIMSTLMFCPGDISLQESEYFQNLQKAATYDISGGQLEMIDANGSVILTYSEVQPLPLKNTTWQMMYYNNGKEALVSSLDGTNITAVFGADGSLTGSAGCNNYMASYSINDSQIAVGQIVATRMYCGEPEGIMDQETAYLTALESAASYEIDGQELSLFDSNNTRAVTYRNIPEESAEE